MSHFKQKLDEVVYHFENKNENLAFRMLTDAVLDTADVNLYKQCILLADVQEKNKERPELFVLKAKELIQQIQNQNIELKANFPLLLTANNIVKKYGNGSFTLGPVSTEIHAGQLLGLVGENGNGKTTLLRMLAKDLEISEGEIKYPFASSTHDDYALRTKLTYIPQRTPKWFGSVKDNLKLTATHYGISPAENEYLVLMWMIRFGLWTFRNHKWNELSSGYKMRFELARTFLRSPKILLLDEPLANLDILSQQLILEDLKLLGKSLTNPLGIILSSQQLYEVEKVSDEVIFLKNGKPSSFNKLKTENNNEKTNLIVEVEIANTREELMSALASVDVNEIKFLGSNYYIEMSNTNADNFLQKLISNGISIKYFRDISLSTRRFFNQ